MENSEELGFDFGNEEEINQEELGSEYVEQEEDNSEVVQEEQEESEESESRDAYYLMSSYGFKDGMIPMEDGEKVHISELSHEEQLEYIAQLRDLEQEKLSKLPDFQEEELELLGELKQRGLTMSDYIKAVQEEVAEKVAQEYEELLKDNQVKSQITNVDDLSDDQLMLFNLQQIMGEDSSAEDLQEELDRRKESKSYSKEVNKLRSDYKAYYEQYTEELKNQELNQQLEVANKHFEETKQTLNSLNRIMGFVITPENKNVLLEAVGRADDKFNTHFATTMINNPENQVKAIWFLENEEEIESYIRGLKTSLEEEKQKAYNKGRNDAIKGKYSTTPVTNNNTVSIKQNSKQTNKDDADEIAWHN